LNNYLAKYHGIEIIILAMYGHIGFSIAGSMLTAFILSVVFNFATSKMHHIIPMPLYLYAPSVSILIPITIHFMLKMGIDVHTISHEMVAKKWGRVICIRGNKKYVRRRIKATRVLRFHGGFLGFKVYDLTKSTKPAYYEAILIYTINALLSIDTSHM
jgi:hypothetical protein